ncbi:retrovirus-related pol polyprotein from transposon TNT 1-94 [Tanacetum coccineum]
MDITRAEQIALDDALVAPTNQLKIGKSNFRLSSELKSKEAALQVVYDVLKLTPFCKAFQITADVPEIYIEMFQICPKLPNQQFEELPFEEAILIFLRDLGHSGEIKMITDVNVNKLHQPWRSFAAVINKCAEPPKTKAWVKKKQVGSDMSKTLPTKGKRLKTSAKAAKTTKKKQPTKTSKAKGLTVLSEVALTEAEQIKLATKISLIQTHSSHASGSGADEGTGTIPGVLDVLTYESDDEQISWKSSEEDDDDEVNVSEDDDDDMDKDEDDDADNQDDENPDDDDEQTDSDNDGDDFVYPKLSTHDNEAR